ncbi:hypothetical protein HO173_006752 [Letharia columbiana]|uniref:Serine hydrolase domain-containing protein n=1 Tax=Letharia columbiana TaxID=112416 RepID=A0A8H6FUP3_9LECA|nr:uncharacterized protein HO173_006752 [Letharia columbiana]KAF6235125.1 hypothetical protein HO173_006752 [Letharia columbiana]
MKAVSRDRQGVARGKKWPSRTHNYSPQRSKFPFYLEFEINPNSQPFYTSLQTITKSLTPELTTNLPTIRTHSLTHSLTHTFATSTPRTTMPPPRPSILCLHGSGTSAAIFSAQTRRLRSALRPYFDLIFVDAPIPSPPGPGVLPFFSDSGPYYKWFSPTTTTTTTTTTVEARQRTTSEIAAVTAAIERGLAKQGRRVAEMAGVLGFSQGTVAAALLLWLGRGGEGGWAGLRFGVMLCGGCRADVVGMIGDRLAVPTVHLHGLADPFLHASRLLTECFRPEFLTVMEFEGGHHCPSGEGDVDRLAGLVVEVGGGGGRRGRGGGGVTAAFGVV